MKIHFYNKGDIDTVSGGYHYNKMLISELRLMGHEVIYSNNISEVEASPINIIDSLVLKTGLMHVNTTKINLALIHQVDDSIIDYSEMHIVVTGNTAKEQILSKVDITADKISVIQPGLDSDWKIKTKYNASITRLLCVANYLEGKGLEEIVIACSKLTHNNWSLEIVGNKDFDVQYVDKIQNLLIDLKLSERVTLFDTVSRSTLNAMMIESDLLVQFSKSETYGMAVYEAIQTGLPVLMYKTGAWKEFQNHERVYIIDDYSVDDLNNRLDALLSSDREMKAQRKEKSRSWQYCAQSILNIINQEFNHFDA